MVHSGTFIDANLHNSPHGLLFERIGDVCTFVSIRQGKIEIYKFPQVILPRVLSSFNGLLLQENVCNKHLYITNPITRQQFAIPPHLQVPWLTFKPSLGYSPSTMEYKVVFWHEVANDNILKCVILTAGVDNSWRDVCTQHISNSSFFLRPAYLTQGFMHWYCNIYVWTLNLETEIMTQTPVPPDVINSYYMLNVQYQHFISVKSKYYLSTIGKSLSVLVLVWLSLLCWDMWEMRSETGEWTKLGHIDLEFHRLRLEGLRRCENKMVQGPMVLVPCGWLEYREVLVLLFSSYDTRLCITYNVLTRQCSYESSSQWLHLHTNSLEWLAPCI